VFEPSEPNSLSAFIIKEIRARGAERTHHQHAYSYQLVTAILGLFFGKNVCQSAPTHQGFRTPLTESLTAVERWVVRNWVLIRGRSCWWLPAAGSDFVCCAHSNSLTPQVSLVVQSSTPY